MARYSEAFKELVVQALYNLSDDQAEFQVRDRLSFQRFLGLSPEDTVPDAKTLWLFREQLTRHGLIDKLFQRFGEQLWQSGLMPKGGQIIDASLVGVPKNRNTRDGNEQIKEGRTPDGWEDEPNMKRRQKDEDARWTKKHGKSRYGYKNHITIDKEHKLIRRYAITDASVHDSQVFDESLDEENSDRSNTRSEQPLNGYGATITKGRTWPSAALPLTRCWRTPHEAYFWVRSKKGGLQRQDVLWPHATGHTGRRQTNLEGKTRRLNVT